jgi:hypothetical protein
MVLFIHPDVDATTKGVKTSFKRYSIYNYKNEDVLCEPYTVRKDDWLYKIFRKKGEISEKDFPLFLIIFSKINPQISNIDAIEPGNNILIPLKKIIKQDYDLSTPETIDVPVVEFTATQEDLNLDPFLKKHTVKKGETVSDLIDKDFLEKGGRLSEEGLKAFQLANPNIKNINIVYEGANINLPDPSIKSQPWFRSLFKAQPSPGPDKTENEDAMQNQIQAHQMAQLKKYASLIGGTLLNHGTMIFPVGDNHTIQLDLSATPVIQTRDGSKILIISGTAGTRDMVRHIQAHWQNLKTQALSEALTQSKKTDQSLQFKQNKIEKFKNLIEDLMKQAGHEYHPSVKIPFSFNSIPLQARFGKIVREETTDLLINFGNVYGTALEILQKREFEIVTITPKLTSSDVVSMILDRIGYSTWKDPSFYTGDTVETISGVYAVSNSKKIFIPFAPLSINAVNYLEKEAIIVLSLDKTVFSE